MQAVWVLCFSCASFIVAASNISSALSSLTLPRSAYMYVVVVIGERVELNCSVTGNNSVSWTYTAWKTSKEENIYLGRDIVASKRLRYTIEKRLNGQHDLIIDSVDLDHAGRYRCTAPMQQSMINDIQLTVLGAEPGCAANTSETYEDGVDQPHLQLSTWCSVNYTGNGTPVFSWTKGIDETDIIANTTASGTSRRPVTYCSTSVIIQQLNANESGVTFKCIIAFMMPNYSESVHVNTWKYSLYGSKNLSIFRHEDRLECAADGNPIPTYKWIHVETNTSTDGSVFMLNGTVTSDKDHTFQCTAANIFGAENIMITIQVTAGDAGVTEGAPVRTAAIGGSLLLLLIIAIIVSCVVCRKRLKDNASDRPDVALNTDISPYDEVVFNSERISNYILEENRLPGRSDGGMISDNVAYSEVSKPKGRSNGKGGSNPGEKSRPIQTQTQERKNFTGADGTEYAELSGVKPPDRNGEVPRPPGFSRVDVYASIDHNGRAPPPPPRF